MEGLPERMYQPEYYSLFYKACVCSAESVGEEKIEYVKNIFIKGLFSTDRDLVGYESLLSLLNNLNNIELVYLRLYYLFKWDITQAKEYQKATGYSILTLLIHGIVRSYPSVFKIVLTKPIG